MLMDENRNGEKLISIFISLEYIEYLVKDDLIIYLVIYMLFTMKSICGM